MTSVEKVFFFFLALIYLKVDDLIKKWDIGSSDLPFNRVGLTLHHFETSFSTFWHFSHGTYQAEVVVGEISYLTFLCRVQKQK